MNSTRRITHLFTSLLAAFLEGISLDLSCLSLLLSILIEGQEMDKMVVALDQEGPIVYCHNEYVEVSISLASSKLLEFCNCSNSTGQII
jgi:hypothetical protein